MTSTETGRLNPMTLDGRTVMITGAGQGIGRAIAEQAFGLGATLALIDLNPDSLAEVQKSLGEDRVATFVGDVSDPVFAEASVAGAVNRFGAVHGLVNNAGITRPALIEKMTLEDWQAVINVHLTGAFLFTQAVGRTMVARAKAGETGPGAIVNIASDAGVQGTFGQINYGAAKAGMIGASMSAAREWAKYGIRVNSVAFGVVETPMTEVVRSDKFRDTYLARIPLGRFTRPEEAAAPVCFLLSEAASYITGQRLSVNGGFHMGA
ncbi:MAG: 3-oxoacyl-ACP reductase [Brevundimonas sp.]|nr:3-oxoacyl-ACP reductase [Brevundimonas sp.]